MNSLDRMQDRYDNMEDPMCCTKPEPIYCKECDGIVPEGSDMCTKDYDFCSEYCLHKWLEENWDEEE